MFEKALWVGVPAEEFIDKRIWQGDANNRFAYFRLDVVLEQPKETKSFCATVEITANSRYRFWVNGKPVGSGPCRGDSFRHFSDKRDLSAYLRPGKNTLSVQVLLCDFNEVHNYADRNMPITSVGDLPAGHRLGIEGIISDEFGNELVDITTGAADWRVWVDDSYALFCQTMPGGNLGATNEDVDFCSAFADWKEADISEWKKAVPIEPLVGLIMKTVGFVPPLPVLDRPIPLLFEEKRDILPPEDKALFPLCLAPGEKCEFTLSLPFLINAYLRYPFKGGKGAKVEYTYFEYYHAPDTVFGVSPSGSKVKRDDAANGAIPPSMVTKVVLPGGDFVYEPFWFRTMRFMKVSVECKDEALEMYEPEFLATGYPLNAEAEISSESAPWVKDVYDICVRTLELCMTDAYMDCPYYEQMQYTMDTRLEAIYTYAVSRDTALARKALDDYHYSMTPYGFVLGKAPSGFRQIISTYSLYYIRMLREYWEHTGDLEPLTLYRSDCDIIIDAFARCIDPKTGLAGSTEFWDFVDWVPEWNATHSAPAAIQKGPSSVLSLMLARAIDDAAFIYELTGNSDRATEYSKKKALLLSRIRETCFDKERGLIREGPDFCQYSRYAQSLAVLVGFFSKEEAVCALERCVGDETILPCTFATSFDFLRACEEADCYDLTEGFMKPWLEMLEDHCTTCPEKPGLITSDCHGWSAVPLYELTHAFPGIRQMPGKPDVYIVKPRLGGLNDLRGSIPVPGGLLRFFYHRIGEEICAEIDAPDSVTVVRQ